MTTMIPPSRSSDDPCEQPRPYVVQAFEIEPWPFNATGETRDFGFIMGTGIWVLDINTPQARLISYVDSILENERGEEIFHRWEMHPRAALDLLEVLQAHVTLNWMHGVARTTIRHTPAGYIAEHLNRQAEAAS